MENRENTGKTGYGNPPEHSRFKPGESGNPSGRPQGAKNRSTVLKKWLDVASKVENVETGKEEPGTVEDKIAVAVIKKAMNGDVYAFNAIMDSVYGKATQTLDISESGKPKVLIPGEDEV